MNSAERSPTLQVLRGRCHTITDNWYKAIAQASFVPHSTAEARQRLVEWTEEAIALLFTEPFEHGRAEAIGASLAGFLYVGSEALGKTQEVLAQQLIEGLPADQAVALQPRLAALLGGLATGFLQQARETTLSEQEKIRGALIAELQRAQQALRKAYDEVEQQVQERTAELRATNESLQREITERKRTEEALRESEERYRGLFEGVPVGLYRTTPDGHFRDVNPAMLKMLDYPDRESLQAVTTADLQLNVTPEDRQRRQAVLERNGALHDLEVQLRRHDGAAIWARSNFRAARDADGQVLYYEGNVEDITERKRAKEELQQAHDELEVRVQERTAELAKANEALQAEIIVRKRVEGALQQAHDELEVRVQERTAQLNSLFEIGQSLTSALDLDRTLRLIAEQAARLLGTDICSLFLYDRDTDELLGQTRSEASDEDPARARASLSHIQTAVEAKATLQPVVVEDTSQDHRVPDEIVEQWGIKSLLTIPLAIEGRLLGVIFLGETNTPRRFTASEIELAQSFASQAAIALQNAQLYAHSEELAINEERNRIAREIHDDLTQRLASLLMRIDLCLELIDGEPEEAKKELDTMGAAVQDSIQEARRSVFALRPLALEQMGFHRALSTYIDDFAHQNEIALHVSLLEEGFRLPARMEYSLFRIVQEALNNVRLHAQADNVWIDLALRSPDRIWLEIRDDGRGFELGKGVDMAGDDDRGLGLLHMRERVEAMRGSFRTETGPTVGTKITVTLPLES